MGYKTVRTSDLSGEDLDDLKVVTVLIRQHPQLEEPRVFDASPEELAGLKPLQDLVELELKSPSGTTATLILNHEDFAAIVSDDKLKEFDSARGRRSGFRPGTNGG